MSRARNTALLVLLLAGLALGRPRALAQDPDPIRRVNAPYFEGEVRFAEMAICWFGQVDSTNNYADVRVGYSDEFLRIRMAAFDRRLWYDTAPGPDLSAWDAATLYLDVDHDGGSAPTADDYRLTAQFNWWEAREDYQAAYQGNGSGWLTTTLPFTSTSGWRGNAPNDDEDDRGWVVTFYVPFASLGLPGPPLQGDTWGMALVLHDRDDAAGTPIADQSWPEAASPLQPGTWGQLAFGWLSYTPPAALPGKVVTIRRQQQDDPTVPDAAVGGTTSNQCPGDPYHIWNEWANLNYGSDHDFNIQNQSDVADWPCFSKYYVTFPLDTIPAGKVIVSATLTLHQYGGAGGPGQAEPSLIQALTVGEDWDESTLTWNNAPLAVENVAAAWADPLAEFPGWPGSAREWDVSGAAAQAYAASAPLRLVLYEADSAYHSGKYFVASDTGDWNIDGRPTLRVRWGNPVGTVDKQASSPTVMPGETLTYTLTILGSGQPLTLSDNLPAGVSAPLAHSPGMTYSPHRLAWTGSPTAGVPVELSYVVTVTAPPHTALWNQVVLTQSSNLTDTAAVLVLVNPVRVYLPLALRHR